MLGGCASDGAEIESERPSLAAAPAPADVDSEQDPEQLLLQATQALESGRLTQPRGDNAAALYRRVLHLDPGNSEALRGSRAVVRKLILDGLQAARRGDYRAAEIQLTRAQQVSFGHPGIANARAQIREWFATSVEDFPISGAELAGKSPAVRLKVKNFAEKVVENGGNFEIYAQSEQDGIWLYRELLMATGDQPLRGRILQGTEPRMRLIYRRY